MKLSAKQDELVQQFVLRNCIGIFRKERTRSTPLDNILTFWFVRTIWVHSGLFSCLTKLVAKRAEQVQKFVPRSRIEIFRHKSTRSTGLYPKLMFWCILHYLGAFGTVRLPYETWNKIGGTSANVRAMKSHRNSSQGTHPIHPVAH